MCRIGSIMAQATASSNTARRVSLLIWVINIRSAFLSLLANKLRTCLAMLGITIGVGAVIAIADGLVFAELGTGRVLSLGPGGAGVLASGLRDPVGVAIAADLLLIHVGEQEILRFRIAVGHAGVDISEIICKRADIVEVVLRPAREMFTAELA